MNGSVCFPRGFGLQPAWHQTRLRQQNCYVTWSPLSGILKLVFDTQNNALKAVFSHDLRKNWLKIGFEKS